MNCEIYKSYKENAEESSQFLSSKQLCEVKSLDVVLNIEGLGKTHLENLRLRSTLEAANWDKLTGKTIVKNATRNVVVEYANPAPELKAGVKNF